MKKVQTCLDLHLEVDVYADGPYESTTSIKATSGHREVIRLLAATDQVDWNKADNHGWISLHVALYRGQENFNCWNISDDDGGHLFIMDTLRLNNPDPNIKDRNGDSPVIKAIKEERERAPDGDSSER